MKNLWSICFALWCSAASSSAAELSVALPKSQNVITLRGSDARWQLNVTRTNDDVTEQDVTRRVQYRVEPPIAEIDTTGYLKPISDGQATLYVTTEDSVGQAAIEIVGMTLLQPVDFHNQVVPIFTKHGCNGGGCHGKAAGQAGFKLSLLGFEPDDDYERLVTESRGRRVFPAMPDRSLLLQKAINVVPHGGGQRLEKDSHEYRVLRRWISSGMPLGNGQDRKVERVEIYPHARQVVRSSNQQLSLIAYYSDGTFEDITRTAQYETNNNDLATVDANGFVNIADQAGDVAVMARYQGQVAVFRASVPLGAPVDSFPPVRNVVDEAVFAKLRTLGIPPSPECDDSTFLRRVTLDICGRLPTQEETIAYLASDAPNKESELVDRLLDSHEYASFFARKWVLILRNKRDSAGEQFGSFAFHNWLQQSFHENTPYDKIVRDLLTASGSFEANPALAWWREVSTTEARVEDSAQLFLGQRLQCARCHHHPFEKWSQADYFHMAAFFSTVANKEGTTPENFRLVSRVAQAAATHPKTGQALSPRALNAPPLQIIAADDPRTALVDWMVQPNNPFFAQSLVNRYWKHFMGVGLVEPEDDLRVTNPPSNQQLMDGLSEAFVDSKFDLKQLIRTICTSSTYKLSSDVNEYNLNDAGAYSRYYPKRLQAEVLLDAIDRVAKTQTNFEALPAGTQANELPDTAFNSYFLDTFGRPAAMTACECERLNETTLAQSLHMLNSKEIQTKLASDHGTAAAMASSAEDLRQLINELYLTALSRNATEFEIETTTKYLSDRSDRKREAFEDIIWAVINSKEFMFNH